MSGPAVIAAMLSLTAGAVQAQGTFAPPAGCEGVLTIQHRSCLMTNVWQCDGDAPDEKWVALFTQAGPFSIRKVDGDFQWLETYYADPPAVERMDLPAADPSSVDELLATGLDSYDFVTRRDDGTAPERIVGFDRLTGETVTIDGEPLLATEFGYETRLPDGSVVYAGGGAQFLSERHRLFILGLSWSSDDPRDVTDMSPIEFLNPGDDGFFASEPAVDCDVVMSEYVR